MKFHFKKVPGQLEKDSILFAKIDCVFELNFVTGEHQVIYKFQNPLKRQPLFFEPNHDQKLFVIASPEDGIHLNMNSQYELDIDMEYDISTIKEVIYDKEENE